MSTFRLSTIPGALCNGTWSTYHCSLEWDYEMSVGSTLKIISELLGHLGMRITLVVLSHKLAYMRLRIANQMDSLRTGLER